MFDNLVDNGFANEYHAATSIPVQHIWYKVTTAIFPFQLPCQGYTASLSLLITYKHKLVPLQ